MSKLSPLLAFVATYALLLYAALRAEVEQLRAKLSASRSRPTTTRTDHMLFR